MEKIPCEDCITLAICKSYVKAHNYGACIYYLAKKCSLVSNYILNHPNKKLELKSGFWRYEPGHEIYSFLDGNDDNLWDLK